MLRWWIILVLAGCTRSMGLQPGGNDRDMGSGDGRDLATVAPPDLSPPPPGWHAETSHTTQDLKGVWGSSANDVYVVGLGGTILHSTGDGVWTAQTSGTTAALRAIWGSSTHDLYAAGDVLLRSSGDGLWQTDAKAPSALMGVWGSATDDVYLSGAFGISHGKGDGTWTAQNQAEPWGGYFHIRGTSADDVYAVGGFINLNNPKDGGGVAHYNGEQWSWTVLAPAAEMKEIVFTTRGAFIVGLLGQIWAKPSGSSAWVQQTSPVPWDLQGLWADETGGLYAVGGSGSVVTSSGDGSWKVQTSLTVLDLWSVWGSSAKDIYTVGDSGNIFHYN